MSFREIEPVAYRNNFEPAVAQYLEDIKGIPVLSREEEQELSRQMEAEYLESAVFDENGNVEYQTSKIQTPAGREIIRRNLRLVVSVAKQYRGRGIPLTDLIQEGNIGLMTAVDKFDYQRGCRLSTYATDLIRQSILRGMVNHLGVVRNPVYILEQINALHNIQSALEQQLQRQPTNQEIAEVMEISTDQVCQLKSHTLEVISLDAPSGNDGVSSTPICETITDESAESAYADIIDGEFNKYAWNITAQLLKTLTQREREVLELRFGIGGQEPMTLKEVGCLFQVTRERIRKIGDRAINRLRAKTKTMMF